ncbi:hypothetical protein C8Q75DRAFT_736287 [Abortiporus biennis]|nr:hypothetical protein C8Q75DRAFT_736287 [Abortiporus biennis]
MTGIAFLTAFYQHWNRINVIHSFDSSSDSEDSVKYTERQGLLTAASSSIEMVTIWSRATSIHVVWIRISRREVAVNDREVTDSESEGLGDGQKRVIWCWEVVGVSSGLMIIRYLLTLIYGKNLKTTSQPLSVGTRERFLHGPFGRAESNFTQSAKDPGH